MACIASEVCGLLAYAARACPYCQQWARQPADLLYIYFGHNRRSQLGREILADVLGLLRFMRKDPLIALQCLASQHLRHRPAHHTLSNSDCLMPAGSPLKHFKQWYLCHAISFRRSLAEHDCPPVRLPAIPPGISRLHPPMALVHFCSLPLYLQGAASHQNGVQIMPR